MTKEALKLALEALYPIAHNTTDDPRGQAYKAITLVKEALAQPEQDSTCSTTLRLQGKPYPRTCKKCGLGPCIAQPTTQPEQEPPKYSFKAHWEKDGRIGVVGAVVRPDGGVHVLQDTIDPPEQEPVAWQWLDTAHFRKKLPKDAGDGVWNPLYAAPQRTERPVDCERCNRLEEQAYDLVGKLRVANIKMSMQPQRTWVGLTGEEAMDVTRKEGHELLDFIYEYGTGVEGVEERIVAICKAIEAKLEEKNT